VKGFTVTIRIALTLAGLTVGVFLSAHLLGLVPDEEAAVMRGRSSLCESIAISFSTMVQRGDVRSMERSLEAIQQRNSNIVSAGIRRADGEFVVQLCDHASHWQDPPEGRSTETHMYVPITCGNEPWGTVEVLFQPLNKSFLWGSFGHPVIALGLYVACSCVIVFLLFLRKILRHLDPSRVVPDRVRTALDTLAEGLLVLDVKGRIVLANSAFGRTVDRTPDQLLGQSASKLPWIEYASEDGPADGQCKAEYPWSKVIEDGKPRTGDLVKLMGEGEREHTFVVNVTPILDSKGTNRGVLATFEDVSDLEEKRVQLSEMLDKLTQSSEQIRQQNAELERLATRDPLTSCYNRRAFFEQFEGQWSGAHRYRYPLSCVMVDIDHFKNINDTFGHQTGDMVLKKIAQVLQSAAREVDVVCRYGGEEFVVLLPHVDIQDATSAAERFRAQIEATPFPDTTITASLGVSAISLGAHDPQALLEQADTALYVAKRNGRNQIVRSDEIPDDVEMDESKTSVTSNDAQKCDIQSIPFQAVTALISSLAYRDLETAEHSRRVADLCVATAEGLMSLRDCYVLENAALLHDIGKVGVPDAILLKPGPLTADEWKVMRRHERIGVEIVEASFNARKLTTIVGNYRVLFAGNPGEPNRPKGTSIPLGARILSIADAYDSMVSDRSYRKGRSPQDAYEELRRCAGTQFDPELVEHFVQTVSRRDDLQDARVRGVSKKAAGSIGAQIERLVTALDVRDTAGLQALAGRLKSSAEKNGVSEVAEKAAHLEDAVETDEDVIEILKAANELVDLCRATQSAYIEGIKSSSDVRRRKSTVAGSLGS